MVDSQNALKSLTKLEEYKNYKKEIKKKITQILCLNTLNILMRKM